MSFKYLIKTNSAKVIKNKQSGIARLKNIDIEIKENESIAIICEQKNERRTLALMLQGKIRRSTGEVLVMDSNIPPFPHQIGPDLKERLFKEIKYIDSSTTSLMIPKRKVKNEFLRTLVEQDLRNNIAEWNKAILYKKIFQKIGKFISNKANSDLLESIAEASTMYETIYFEKRNILHFRQLRKTTFSWFFLSVPIFLKWSFIERREIKRVILQDELNDNTMFLATQEKNDYEEFLANSNDELLVKNKNNLKKVFELTKKIKSAKSNIRYQKMMLLDVFYSIKKSSNVQDLKVEKIKFQKYEYIDLYESDSSSSLSQTLWYGILNIFKKLFQQKLKFKHKSLWKKFRFVQYIDSNLSNEIYTLVSNYVHTNSNLSIKKEREKIIHNSCEITELPKSYLNYKIETLSKFERFHIELTLALCTNPSLIIIDDTIEDMDITLRGRFLEIVKNTQQRQPFALLFLTDDIEVGCKLSDKTYILNESILEKGHSNSVLFRPIHPYTSFLISTIATYESFFQNVFNYEYENVRLGKSFNEIYENHFVLSNNKEAGFWKSQSEIFEVQNSIIYFLRSENIINVI